MALKNYKKCLWNWLYGMQNVKQKNTFNYFLICKRIQILNPYNIMSYAIGGYQDTSISVFFNISNAWIPSNIS